MKTKVQFILLSGLASLFCACNGKNLKSEHELLVDTAEVATLFVENSKEFPFITQPFRTSELSFRVSGTVVHFEAYPGSRYRQGAVLAEIDPRDFKIRKARAEAVYYQAKTEYNRIESLYRKENISASAYEKAKMDYASAQAAFSTASNELADTRLLAPFTGYVGEVHFEKFQDIKASQPILSLIDIHQLKIEIYITQDIAYAAQKADSIQLHFDAFPNKIFKAHIAEVSKGTTSNNLSYLITAFLPNKDGELLAGMSGKAILNMPKVTSVSGVCIPQDALCHRPSEGNYVWTINLETHLVNKRKVTFNSLLPNGNVSISQGLYPGEVVAISNLRFLSDGMSVSPTSKTK